MQAVVPNQPQGFVQLGVPDPMFTVFAAGIGLAAVPVTEARVDPQPYAVAGGKRSQLMQHVDGADIDLDLRLHYSLQGGSIKHIGREHDTRRSLHRIGTEPGLQSPLDLAEGNRIHLRPSLTHQTQDMEIGTGFLGKTHRVEYSQLPDALLNQAAVIHPQRGAMLLGQLQQQVISEGFHISKPQANNARAAKGYHAVGGMMMETRPSHKISIFSKTIHLRYGFQRR